jgi:hypothetical protein
VDGTIKFLLGAESMSRSAQRAQLRREENRARLDCATAAYFEGLTAEARAEERELARQLSDSTRGLDFDHEFPDQACILRAIDPDAPYEP